MNFPFAVSRAKRTAKIVIIFEPANLFFKKLTIVKSFVQRISYSLLKKLLSLRPDYSPNTTNIMKRILTVIAAAFIALSANAQWYAGGSLGLGGSSDYTSLIVAPEVGYSIDSNWTVGASLSFNHYGMSSSNQINFSLAPFARYFFYNIGNLNVFAEANAQLTLSSFNHKTLDELDSNEFTFAGGLALGATYDISTNLCIATKVLGLSLSGDEGLTFNIQTPSSIGIFYKF